MNSHTGPARRTNAADFRALKSLEDFDLNGSPVSLPRRVAVRSRP